MAIITLCGSTRFTDEMMVKKWELTKQGHVVTFVHRIHHINYSYGYMLWPIGVGYFQKHGFKWCARKQYHNCTTTGIY